MDIEGCWRDVAEGINEEQVQEAGGESKEGDVSGEDVAWKVYDGCQ